MSGGDTCAGQCVPHAPLGWSDPALLWFGPPGQEPPCPESASRIGYQGHADLGSLPHTCAACGCDPPQATCSLPLDWSAANDVCPADAPGTIHTPFAAPAGWDGSCTSVDAIAGGESCAGEPCVQSLSIPAPVVTSGPCTPKVTDQPAPKVDYPWALSALACVGTAYPPCADSGDVCAPAPPPDGASPPEGFLTCIFHEGELACPDEYTTRRIFYEGVDDTRTCTECACGAPEGASCSITASVFTDGACSAELASNTVSSAAPFCGITPPGAALGSKSVTLGSIEPGTCPPSGGVAGGGLAPSGPSTFCCR